ncbi:hypothetical protein FH972_024323 [Carpinus fangiana]|uniref:Arrestin C-terminal-like domain-containing protein n=1 Tax=Carpinus fangiana TaxID=176857 RepID=A0A5N6KYF8_9ROSI|nr:hypothetical protein FH972_024323 [Carpinus fangiana]
MPAPELLRQRASIVSVGPFSAGPRRPSVQDNGRQASTHSRASSTTASISIPEERPIATGNGVSISVNLAEPTLYLQGYDPHGSGNASTVMLRGSLHMKVAKTAKIKAVTLKFNGTATTRWPEGIPPKRVDFEEVDAFHNHTWTFFNAHFPTAEYSTGADHVRLSDGIGKAKNASPYMNDGSPAPSSTNLSAPRSGPFDKRLSLQHTPSRSFEKGEKPGNTVNMKGYKTFHPGDYIYNFEHAIDSRLPETISADLGSVKYQLEAIVERAGAFKANLIGHKEVEMIRAPSEGSLEQVEPIAISRNWEDQLHYDIVISGKSFPLGAKVPIAFKLTPLAKVQCHRIKVFVTENTEYFCNNKRVHRMEPTRKVLLFEKRADAPPTSTFQGSSMRITAGGGVSYDQREAAANGEDVTTADSSNLLGRLAEDNPGVGPTEMEFQVQLPGCHESTDKDRPNRLHFDTTYQNIQVHHWIKVSEPPAFPFFRN